LKKAEVGTLTLEISSLFKRVFRKNLIVRQVSADLKRRAERAWYLRKAKYAFWKKLQGIGLDRDRGAGLE
jgi:hypothetical protein